jgi:hypothetical protein
MHLLSLLVSNESGRHESENKRSRIPEAGFFKRGAEPSPDLIVNGARYSRWFLLVLGAATCFLFTALFSLSGIPYFRTGDEDFFWTYASRMLSGQVFLKDFHQFTPPGTDIVYAAFFRLSGVGMSTINGAILILGLVLAVCVFRCSRFVLRPSLAALSALFAVVILFGDRLDATHHWFSSVANLLAVAILIPRRTYPRIIAAGALLACAAFCTQTRGAAGLIACCAAFLWEKWRGEITTRILYLRITVLLIATFLVWLALSWRFIAQAGLATYWYEQVVYLHRDTNFPRGFLIPTFAWPTYPRAAIILMDRILIYLMLLSACPWVAFQCLRRLRENARQPFPLFLLASLGIMQTFEVITALNWIRMEAIAIPSAILTIYLVSGKQRSHFLLIAACWSLLVVVAFAECLPQVLHRYTLIRLPTGPALFREDDSEQISWLVMHTRPGDTFLEVANTRLYALLQLRNPTPVDLLTTENYTPPERVSEAIQGLDQSRTRYILWSQRSGIGSVNGMHTIESDHLDPLRRYLQNTYTCVQTFANGDQIWERRNLRRKL